MTQTQSPTWLRSDRSFADQFWFFALPYALYVGGNALHPWLGRTGAAVAGGALSAGALLLFARQNRYRGKLRLSVSELGPVLLWGLFALVAWVGLYWACLRLGTLPSGPAALGNGQVTHSPGYLVARGLASALVVPFAEEFFCRAFCLDLGSAWRRNPPSQSLLDSKPSALSQISWLGAGALSAGLIFTLGHPLAAWPAAMVWFALTQRLYQKTGNLFAVIVAHALANGIIALLVSKAGWHWLW